MRFCTHCGKELVAGDSFCRYCGTRIDNEPVTFGNKTKSRRAPVGQRRKRKIVIPLVILIVLALGTVTVFGFPYIKNSVIKSTMSPRDYFCYVMDKQADHFSEAFSSITEQIKDNVDSRYMLKSNTEIDIGDELLPYLEELTGESVEEAVPYIGWIDKIKLLSEINNDGSYIGSEMGVDINDKHILNCDLDVGLNDGEVYLTSPEINQTALKLDIGSSSDDMDGIKNIYNLIKQLPQKDVVKELIHDYIMTAIEPVNDVKSERVNVSIDNTSQNCTALTARIDLDVFEKVSEAVLEKIKTDEELKNIIEAFSAELGSDPNEMYEMFIHEMENSFYETINNMYEEDKDIIGDITLWVNAKGDVIGMSIASDGVEIRYLNVIDWRSFASEFVMHVDDATLQLKGYGTAGINKCNAEYCLNADGKDLICAHLNDVNISKLKDGYFEGSVVFETQLQFEHLFYTQLNESVLARSKIKYESFRSDKNMNEARISLMCDDEPIISIYSDQQKKDNNKAVQIPSVYNVFNDYDDFSIWREQCDYTKIIDNLSAAGATEEMINVIREEID